MTKNFESENEEALKSEPQPLVGPLEDEGGSTSEEDRVTANLRIFKASFQWAAVKLLFFFRRGIIFKNRKLYYHNVS